MVQTTKVGLGGVSVLALVALCFSLSACRQQFEGLGVKLTLEQRKLSNGLEILFVPDHTVPVVTYQTWYRVGSIDEKAGMTGMAHLFEHLMFKGTPKYGPKAFFQNLEAKGAEVNAYTTRDYTVYYQNFTPQLLEKVIDMEADRMSNLILDDQVLQTERNVVLEERRLRTDNSPAGKMQEALWDIAYERHPYSWPVVGYPQDLMRITVKDLQEFFKTHYQPGNAILVIAGDIDVEQSFQLIKKYYGSIEGRKQAERKLSKEPDQNEERRLTLYDQVASERFAHAYHVTRAEDDDSYALDVLANILFEGTSSRAYRKLVEEKNVALGVSGSAYTPTYPGLFIISGSMKGDLKSEVSEKLLEEVIREAQDKGVTDEEIRIAVKQLTVQLVDSVRTPYGLAQLIGTVMMVFGEPERFSSDLEKYLKVTQSDVQRVAKKYLVPNNRSIVTLLPESRRAKK